MTETTKKIHEPTKTQAMDPMHQVQLDSSYNDPWPRRSVGGWLEGTVWEGLVVLIKLSGEQKLVGWK